MICPNCGKNCSDFKKFCPGCGELLPEKPIDEYLGSNSASGNRYGKYYVSPNNKIKAILVVLLGIPVVIAISYFMYLLCGGFLYFITGGDMGDKGEATFAAVIAGLIGIVWIILVVLGIVSPANQNNWYSSSRYSTEDISTMTGHDYEKYVASILPSMGYRNVRVTKGSGDFGADIIAIDNRTGQKTAFQCKLYSKPVGVKAVQEIVAAKSYYRCDKTVVVTNSTFTEGARKLARVNNVALMENIR